MVPCKFRLISLLAALKSHFRADAANKNKKVLVFLSNCDSVDFHEVLLKSHWDTGEAQAQRDQRDKSNQHPPVPLPAVIKLHGNMSQIERTRSLLAFTKVSRGTYQPTLSPCRPATHAHSPPRCSLPRRHLHQASSWRPTLRPAAWTFPK